ncbi:MAG TPA: hypothetical protein EYQ86_03975 [Bacteroidetes bacterium]|nr:hypothetical protein [Bacteroidota bacterium]
MFFKMKDSVKSLTIGAICLFLLACYWDKDTIEMERQQFPSVIELISGKFLRHSPEFHYWRIKERSLKLKASPDSLSLYDDLAVSYSKIGNDKKAIEIMLKKDSLKPGQYETYANLGTFYVHDGQYKIGLKYIEKAIEVNPDAHFGREIYQKRIVQRIIRKMDSSGHISLPLKSIRRYNSLSMRKYPNVEKEIIGIMGMMKFGNFNSPILLEILGHTLFTKTGNLGARHLAARAYTKASMEVKDSVTKAQYKLIASRILEFQKGFGDPGPGFNSIEALLMAEIEAGNKYYEQIRADEIEWIRTGKDPEKEFAKKYYSEPELEKDLKPKKKIKYSHNPNYHQIFKNKANIDYRPVLKSNVNPDTSAIEMIDQIYKRKLVYENKAVQKDNDNEKELVFPDGSSKNLNENTSGNKTFYILFIIAFIAISSILFLIIRNKR